MNTANKVTKKILPIAIAAIYIWMMVSSLSLTVLPHEVSLFNLHNNGSVTVSTDTPFEAASESGGFCLSKMDKTAQICSQPAPRPNNSDAHTLKGVLTQGTWKMSPSVGGATIQSDSPLIFNQKNIGGMIIMSIMLTVILGFLFYCSTTGWG